MDRQRMLRDLTTATFDLLIIGGGITGAGVAREASLRGLRVALVERADFAYGTSSRSTKLIHGGLRYLKNMEFRLVRESVQERMRLMRMAPHLARMLPFLFPVYEGDPDGRLMLRLGLSVYDWFAGAGNPRRHRMHPAAALLDQEPILDRKGLLGGAIYGDCATNDGRLTLEVIQSAAAHGAVVANYAEVQGFRYDRADRIAGARIEEVLTGETLEVQARQVLSAAGPWADHVRRLDDPGAERLLRLTKGVHLTVPRERLPLRHAVVMRGRDARLMFAIPAGLFSYLGTTDSEFRGDPEQVAVEWEDAAYILEAARRAFPECSLSPDDVVSSWAGLRPLVRPQGEQDLSAISRDYVLHHCASGLLTVAGGKLTAFRAMASHIVDELFPGTSMPAGAHLAKSLAPLPGAAGEPVRPEEIAHVAQETASPELLVARLAEQYGTALRQVAEHVPAEGGEPELRWLLAQARHGVLREMAVRLEDLLVRRTGMLLFSAHNGRPYVEAAAAEMGGLLGWSPQRRRTEEVRCHAQINAMFDWRQQAFGLMD